LKSKVVPEIANLLGKPMTVREVKFNPFAFTLGVEGLAIDDPDGSPLVGFGELFVDFNIMSVLGDTYQFDTIRLILPYGSARIRPDGTFNLSELGVTSDAEPAASGDSTSTSDGSSALGLPPIEVALFTIEQGFVEFRDQSRPKEFITDIVPIQITLRNFSTRKGQEQSYFIVAEMEEDEVMQWDGTMSLDPFQSQGRVDFKGIELRALWEFVQDQLQFEIMRGVLDFGGRYQIKENDTPDIVFTEGTVQLREMQLREKGHKDEIVDVPHIAVTGMVVNVPTQEIVINSVQSRGSRFTGWLTKDGALNFQSIFGGDTSGASATPSPKPDESSMDDSPWDVLIKDLAFTGFSVNFEDRMPDNLVSYHIDNLDLNVKNIRADLAEPIVLEGGLTLNETGIVKVKGLVGFNPLKTDLTLDLSNIGLRSFQSYLSPYVQFELSSGTASFKGKTRYRGDAANRPHTRFSGELTVTDVGMKDPVQGKQFLGWKQLAFRDFTVEMEPLRLVVGEILLIEPSVQVVRSPDHVINLSRVFFPPQSAETEKTATKSAKSSPPVISVETVQLVDLAASFTDQTVEPTVVMNIQELSGSIKGLSTKERSSADLAFIGTVDDIATLRVEGQINPFEENTATDLAVFITNWDLTTVAPYAEKYIGYPIKKGKLSLNLQYTLLDNILVGENKVIADQLTLGDRVDSPDASDLPIPLAMALLKDRDGGIDIDLPVRGDLNDPEFSYAGILWQAFVNLIMKAVSSPFALVGDILGVNAEDLEYVGFSPGRAELPDEEAIKLERLVGALDLRPGLRLEISGQSDPQVDRMKLAEDHLMAVVRDRKRKERRNVSSLDSLFAESGEESAVRIITQMFAERFPGQMSLRASQSQRTDEPIRSRAPRRSPSFEEMKGQLIASIPVDEETLRQLAQQRAKRIRNFIVNEGGVSEERVFLVDSGVDASGSIDLVKTTLALTAG
ncbi:MAG: DUF748 domain-containing protein, partial [Nitrospirota bacterium]|nr:DUF748 domain-containing protein [Nitrospirota bacterium]